MRSPALVITLLLLAGCAAPPPPPAPQPRPVSPGPIGRAERAIQQAVDAGDIPGAVLVMGDADGVRYRKALGYRSVEPARQPMTDDTLFDLASLTKPAATAVSIMKLAEQGRLRLDDPVAKYLPGFGAAGKQAITIEQCLLHRAGFVPDNPISDYATGPEAAMHNIYDAPTKTPPGQKFVYSDVGYIVLGEVVKAVSGQRLDAFAAEHVYKPLAMNHTGFLPGPVPTAAPTERREGRWMLGEVHDPRSYALGGVAGHAGLFGTADDLARFCRMLLRGGELDGRRVLKAATVQRMTEPHCFDDGCRTLGFDSDTGYSTARGLRFEPRTTFGHTGFTGTMFWIDPRNGCFVILLTNRVHPDGKGSVGTLRKAVMTYAAEAMLGPATGHTLTGIDTLENDDFAPLAGQHVALITNHTGLDRFGRRTADVLQHAPNLTLITLMSPEHGIDGKLDAKIGDTVDEKTGLKVWSLYGESRRPTPAMLEGVDTIVFDIQDIGTRFYTYISTMGNAMETAAARKLKFVVLDRPNPIAPMGVDGPPADADKLSFTAYKPLPVTHGMTVGELATLLNDEFQLGCDLSVVKLANWNHAMWWDQTGLTWVNPSPNMRSLSAAILYPAIGLLEFTNVSVGRGTAEPFERLGAPWITAGDLVAALNAAELPGLSFEPEVFTPDASKFTREKCGGVRITITDRAAVKPVLTGLTIAATLQRLYGKTFESDKLLKLLANDRVQAGWQRGADPAAWAGDVERFEAVRRKHLLYP